MKNLNKVLNVWSDLESSYETLKGRLGVSTRLEFIYKIAGYKNKTTQIDIIKSTMKGETSDYTTDELESYSKLINKLEAIDYVLISADIESIDNLDRFADYCIGLSVNNRYVGKTVSDELFQGMSVYGVKANVVSLSSKSMYDTTEFLTDVYTIKDKSPVHYKPIDRLGEIITIRNNKELEEFVRAAKTSPSNKFMSDVLKLLGGLIKDKKFKFGQSFISPTMFKLEGNKVTLLFAKEVVIPIRKNYHGEVNSVQYVKCSIKNYYIKQELYLVL